MLVIGILVLASSLSFGLGYLAGRDAGQGSNVSVSMSPAAEMSEEGQVVASRNGTKYYLPGCTGASRISETNKVWFVSASAAEAAGYSAAANCAGL